MQAETEKKAYTIERLSADRLKDLHSLYRAVYGRPARPGFFKEKYNTAYTGAEWLGYIAYLPNQIPIAYYGVMPCRMEYLGQQILAAQSGDTMTHPQYRFKGLFVELSKMTFDLCRNEGINFIFGFPNQNSLHGAINKLGWQMTENLYCFTIPVRTLRIASFSKKFNGLNEIYQVYKNTILKRFLAPDAGIPNSVIGDGFDGILRDEAFLKYKFYGRTSVIRLGNAKAWVKFGNELTIGDLQLNGESFDNVLQKIVRIASLLGIGQIFFHACQQTQLYKLFAARYASIPSFPALFQDLGQNIDFSRFKFTFADIDIF